MTYRPEPGTIVGEYTANLPCATCGPLTVHLIERQENGVTFYRCTLCKEVKK